MPDHAGVFLTPPLAKAPKKPELYDLSKDLSETTNVADQNPEMVAKMAKLLAEIQAKGGHR